MRKQIKLIYAVVPLLFLTCQVQTPVTLDKPSGKKTIIEWVSAAVTASGLQHKTFESAIVGTRVSYHIYLPEQYQTERNLHFPVLYWLHGSGGKPNQDHQAGGGKGSAVLSRHFGDAMREGKIPPMIVVFPNGLRKGMWCDSKDGITPIESLVIKELIPHIDTNFRTIVTRAGRMVAGHSAGGYGAARLAFKHPSLFCAVSLQGAGPLQRVFVPSIGPKGNAASRARLLKTVYGGDQEYFRQQSPWMLAEKNANRIRGKIHVRQLIGEKDYTLPANRQFHAHLTKLGIPHVFKILAGVKHDPRQLIEILGSDAEYWRFYRTVFSQAGQADGSGYGNTAQPDSPVNQKPATPASDD